MELLAKLSEIDQEEDDEVSGIGTISVLSSFFSIDSLDARGNVNYVARRRSTWLYCHAIMRSRVRTVWGK